jgi:hypothetical protein
MEAYLEIHRQAMRRSNSLSSLSEMHIQFFCIRNGIHKHNLRIDSMDSPLHFLRVSRNIEHDILQFDE